jgi:hypothetical protein
MFMWKLHGYNWKDIIMKYQNVYVYVNVIFSHWKDSERSKCLCEYDMINLRR